MKNVSEFCKCGHCESDEQAFYCDGKKVRSIRKLEVEDYIIIFVGIIFCVAIYYTMIT